MTVREQTQLIEERNLSPYALLSKNTKGRELFEEECPLRTPFQRDRDRIIHSKSFRRLKQKTQVFLSPEGDHYRTRLTHTLEVSQIARTLARALKLNEDLAEAIALGHDLGHTAFGHAGERALNIVNPAGFKHYEQSVRVVQKIEKQRKGLNLNAEVLDGFLCHSGKAKWADTLEGQIVRYADKIAYINHDIEDAISAGVLKDEDLPQDVVETLGKTKSERITTLIVSLVENSKDGEIAMSENVFEKYKKLQGFMFEKVYVDPIAKAEEAKVEKIITDMYKLFSEKPECMPEFYLEIAEAEGVARAVTDYISGMSDDFAINKYEEFFVPKKWTL